MALLGLQRTKQHCVEDDNVTIQFKAVSKVNGNNSDDQDCDFEIVDDKDLYFMFSTQGFQNDLFLQEEYSGNLEDF